jgi:hypothetical protein
MLISGNRAFANLIVPSCFLMIILAIILEVWWNYDSDTWLIRAARPLFSWRTFTNEVSNPVKARRVRGGSAGHRLFFPINRRLVKALSMCRVRSLPLDRGAWARAGPWRHSADEAFLFSRAFFYPYALAFIPQTSTLPFLHTASSSTLVLLYFFCLSFPHLNISTLLSLLLTL